MRAHYERLAALPSLTRLIPSHGQMVNGGAAATLARVAASI